MSTEATPLAPRAAVPEDAPPAGGAAGHPGALPPRLAPKRPGAALARLGRALLKERDPGRLLSEGARGTAEVLGVRDAMVFEAIPARGVLVVRAGTGGCAAAVGDEEEMDGRSQVAATWRSGDSVVASYAESLHLVPARLLGHGVAGGVAVLIDGPERPYGVLAVFWPHPGCPPAEEVALVQVAAGQLGQAMARLQVEARLDEREYLYHQIYDQANDEVFVYHPEPGGAPAPLLDVNAVACERLGYPRAELLRMRFAELLDAAEGGLCARLDRLQERERLVVESVLRRRDGGCIPVEVSAHAFVYHGRLAVMAICRNISRRRQAELALQESEARVRAILDTTVDAIITVDARGHVGSFNQAAERLFGYRAADVVGRDVRMLIPRPGRDGHDDLRRYLKAGTPPLMGSSRKLTGRRRDGTTFPLELAVSEVDLPQGRLFTGIVRDLSERQRLEQEILQISEVERQRIGQDLHDGLGSLLSGMALMSTGLAKRARAGSPIDPGDLEEIASLAGSGAERARALAHGLNPVRIEAQGLETALQELVAQTSLISGLPCTFDCRGPIPDLDGASRNHVYWITHEALTNAVRHARATHLWTRLERHDDRLVLEVEDDGVGVTTPERGPAGMGLRTMRYRAELVGATFSIQRGRRRGTRVQCSLAVRPVADELP